jgi:phage terminase small subunit
MPLDNPRRQKFVDAYLVSGNATQAALEAGYAPKTATVQGSRLLRSVHVKAAIEQAQVQVAEKAEMTAVQVLKELATLATSDIRHYRVAEDGSLALAEGAPDSAMRCVSGVHFKTRTITTKGKTLVEKDCHFTLWSKPQALQLLAKHFALLVERHEVNLTQQHLARITMMSDLELQMVLQAFKRQEPEAVLQLLAGEKAS